MLISNYLTTNYLTTKIMDEDLKKLLQENLAKTQEIHQVSLKIKRYLVMAQLLSILRLLIIVVPIVLAIIYLPPFFREAFAEYKNLLNSGGESSGLQLPF